MREKGKVNTGSRGRKTTERIFLRKVNRATKPSPAEDGGAAESHTFPGS